MMKSTLIRTVESPNANNATMPACRNATYSVAIPIYYALLTTTIIIQSGIAKVVRITPNSSDESINPFVQAQLTPTLDLRLLVHINRYRKVWKVIHVITRIAVHLATISPGYWAKWPRIPSVYGLELDSRTAVSRPSSSRVQPDSHGSSIRPSSSPAWPTGAPFSSLRFRILESAKHRNRLPLWHRSPGSVSTAVPGRTSRLWKSSKMGGSRSSRRLPLP